MLVDISYRRNKRRNIVVQGVFVYLHKQEDMKRAAIYVLLLLSIAASFTACEKCTVCTSSTPAGDMVTEECGNEPDIRSYEDFFVDSVTQAGFTGYCERGPDN